MKRTLLLATFVLGAGCFNFEAAYQNYCDGGRCTATGGGGGGGTHTGGGSSFGGGEGGGVATGGGSGSTGGGVATGGGQGTGGGTATGGGSGRDAGCLGYGATCSTEGECCAAGDGGLPLACSRNNYCQDVAPDCRNEGYTCSGDGQCCSQKCSSGRCAACGADGDSCTSAANCCAGSACVSGLCSSSNGAANGARCQGSDICQSEWCDARDAGPNDGVCTDPNATGNACTPAGVAATTLACCAGLTQGTTCCMPDQTWCYHDTECCSGNCYGGRCGPQPGRGHRCESSGNCLGENLCDPVNGICENRWCLPAGRNLYTGCCKWLNYPGPCIFPDAGSCLIPGTPTSNAASCCSGTISGGYCDAVQLF